jgi:hypothetical protein
MTTWLLTFIAGVAVVFLLVMAVNWLYRGFRTISEEFYCPWIDRSVQVTYLTLDGRRPIGVLSCSAFADTTGVLCGTPCLASGGRAGAPAAEKEDVRDLLND